MHVLYLTHSFPRYEGDAAGAFILRLAVALADENVNVRVLAPASATVPAHDVISGIPVSRFRYAPRALETLAYEGNMASQVRDAWGARAGLVGLLGAELSATLRQSRAGRTDVLHAHWWFPSGVVGAAAARWRGLPLVTTLHGSDVRLGRSIAPARPVMRAAFRGSARVTAVSRWLATEAHRVTGGEVPIVAPMPVATELFSPDPAVRRGRNLLFVGRLTRQKGLDLLLRALVILPGDVGLDVVGAGEERASLETLAATMGVASRVRWHGARPSSQLAAFYRHAAALVVPSENEGLGLVAVEAQLCETPVIAFASGGVVDVVRDGETGLLVPERTSEALAHAVAALLARPDHGTSLARAAAVRARAEFSPTAAARRYLDIYREAIDRPAH